MNFINKENLVDKEINGEINGDINGEINGDINGGKAIDSGGFGCIFLPSLKCKNSIESSNNNFTGD